MSDEKNSPTDKIVGSTDGLDFIMSTMREKWRQRWCEPGAGCGCMGCANYSGGLLRLGYKKEQWEEWIKSNGKETKK